APLPFLRRIPCAGPYAGSAFPGPNGDGKSRLASGRMEKTRLRRFDFALLQDQQTGSGRATTKAELRFHFHSHHDRVRDENILARERGDRGAALILSGPAYRTHSFLAGCLR